MANQVVELLFGVQGGASINGQSGRRIREDILGIVQDLKGTQYTQIEFSASQTSLTKLREDVEKALKDVHVTFAAEVKGGITDGSKSGNSGSGGEKNGEKETKKRIKELKATQTEVLKLMSIYRDFYKWQGDALGAGGPTDLDKQNKLLDKSQQKFEQAETVLKKYSWSAEQLAQIDAFIAKQEEELAAALAQHEKAQESLSEATKQGLKEQQEQSAADKQRIKDLNDLFNLYKRAASADMDAQYADDPSAQSRYIKEGNKLLEQANTLRQRLNLTEKEALEIEERLSKTGYEFTTLGGKYAQGFQAQADAAQRAAAAMEHLDASDDEMVDDAQRTIAIIARIQKQLLAFDNLSHKQSVIAALDPKDLAAFQAEANAVGKTLRDLGVDAAVADIQLDRVGDDGQLQDLLIKINNLVLGLRNATGQASGLATANVKLETSYHKLANRAHDYMARIQGTLSRDPGMMQEMQNLVDRLHRGDFESVAHGAQEFQKLQFRIKQAGLEAETLGQQVSRIFKEKFGFGVMATAAMYARSAISDVARTVVDLDTKLTELKIVSGETGQAMVKYMDDAAAAAKRVASSITDIIDATTVYRRLGFEMNKSLDFAELTTMYSKVGKVDMSAAEDSVTSIIKAFDLNDVEQVRQAMDQLVLVGNNFAVSSSQLGEGLQNAGAALMAAGNTFTESLALLTASNNTLQDISKASTAMRTISARLRQSSAELEEIGDEGLAAEYNTTSKYRAKLMAITGVDILENDLKTFRSTYEILKDISNVWEQLEDIDQAAVTEMLGGVRNQSQIASIMATFDDAEKIMADTANAAGSMQSAYENYIDSIQGRLNTLTASSQELFNNLLDSDLIKGGVSAVTALVEALNSLIETIGLLPTIGAGVGLYKLISSVGAFKNEVQGALALLDGLSKVEDVTAILQTYDSTLAKVALSQAALADGDKARILGNLEEIKTKNLIHKANIQDIVDMAKLNSRESQKLKASLQTYAAKAAESQITDTLTRKELEEALTSAKVTVAKRQEILARYDNAAAAKKESSALDLYAGGLSNAFKKLWAWIGAHKLLTGVGIAVGALALAFRQAKKDIEKANEAVEEYKTQCSELESTLHSNQRTVASIKDEFAKLSHGIGSSGENIGLTSDEFERYNSIANQVADMFPDMVQGYTDQGNAILSCKGNVEALTKALQEQQEAYYNTLLSGADTIYDKWNGTWFSNNFGNIFGDGTETHQAEELKTQLELYDDILQSANVSVVALSNTLEKIRSKTSATNDGGGWVLPDDDYIAVYGNLFKALGDGFELTAESRWELQRAAQQLREAVANELQELTEQDSAQLRLAVNAHLELTDAMDGLPADVRATVRTFTSSLSYEFFSAFKDDPASMYDWIDQHIIAPLTDPATRADFQAGLEFLLSKNVDVSRLNSRFVDEYGKALGKLKNAFSENANQDWLKLYASDRDIETLIDHLKDLGAILSVDNDAILAIAKAFSEMEVKAENATDNTTDAIADLTAGLTKIVEKLDLVKQVQDDFADTGIITADALTSIVEKFPDMASSVNLYIAGAKSAKELMADLKKAYKTDEDAWREDQKAKLYSSREFCDNLTNDQSKLIDALAESYKVDLENFETIEELKAQFQEQIIKRLADNYSRYANMTLADLKAQYAMLAASTKKLMQSASLQALDGDGNNATNTLISGSLTEMNALKEAIDALEGAYAELDEGLTSPWDPSKFSEEMAKDAEDEFEKFKKQWNDWFSDMEFKLNLKYDAGDIDGATAIYQQMVDKAQELLNDAYAQGMTIDDDWVQELVGKVGEYKKALADLRIEGYDRLIEYNDEFDVWDKVSYTKLDKLKEKLAAINEQYIAGLRTYQDWYEIFTKTASEIYEIQRDALDAVLDEMLGAIKQGYESEIDMIEDVADAKVKALEDEKTAYAEIIALKKKLLEDTKDEANYERQVADKVREIAKLQERISQLALDGSREATAERLKLEEELYEKQRDLEDYMNEYATDATLDALDEQQEAFEKEKDKEIEAAEDAADAQIEMLRDQLDNEIALRQQAINQINRDYQTMLNDIVKYFRDLGYEIDDSIINKLREGLGLVAQFGSYGAAGSGIGNPGGMSNEVLTSLVRQMKDNSTAWHNSGDTEKARLAAENERIAELLKQMGFDIWKDSGKGIWYIRIDGKDFKLFEYAGVYHTGGVAGNIANPKADEIFALLRKGEVILNGEQQSSLLNIFNNAGKWMQNQMQQTIGSIVGNPRRRATIDDGRSIASFSPNIEVNISHNGNMTDADARRYGNQVATAALDHLWSTLNKRGIT